MKSKSLRLLGIKLKCLLDEVKKLVKFKINSFIFIGYHFTATVVTVYIVK